MTQKQLRLLLVHPFFYPHKGGSEKFAEEIYAKMLENNLPIRVDVLTYDTNKTGLAKENYRDMTLYRIPCWNLIPDRFVVPNPIKLINTLKYLEKNQYDFVNTHIRFFDPTWWLWLYASKINAKSFYTEHVPIHPIHKNILIQVIAKVIDKTLGFYSVKKYNFLTAVNSASVEFLKTKIKAKQDILLTRIAVNTKKFVSTKQNNNIFKIPNTQTEIKQADILITFLGRLIETKGVEMLVDLAMELSNQKNNIKFVIAGSGGLENNLKNKLGNNNYPNIILTGALSYEQSAELLGRTDIFVNPSHHNEGLPTTLVEAGSCECCVIATDMGGTKELIENNVTGFLIPPKNMGELRITLIEAIKNIEKRQELAKNLKSKVMNEYDLEKNSKVLFDLLSKF